MARPKREGATKHTFRLADDVMTEMARIATKENRTTTAQIEVFLKDKIKEYQKWEKTSGNWRPAQKAA